MEAFLHYERAFPPDFCDAVIECGEAQPIMDAMAGDEYRPEARQCEVSFLPLERRDIRDTVYDLVAHANAQAFGAEIRCCHQLQFTKYNKGHFYGQHIDLLRPSGTAYERKLSISILLSEPDDFEGGDLIIEGNKVELTQRGAAVVFPSLIPHEVTKVTKGTRLSLVSWIEGPPWR